MITEKKPGIKGTSKKDPATSVTNTQPFTFLGEMRYVLKPHTQHSHSIPAIFQLSSSLDLNFIQTIAATAGICSYTFSLAVDTLTWQAIHDIQLTKPLF